GKQPKQHRPGLTRDERVHAPQGVRRSLGAASHMRGGHDRHLGAVHLLSRHQRLRQHPKPLAEPPAVLQHVGRIIAHMQPEIKAMERMKTYTAAALGDAVHDAPLKPRLHLPHGDPAQTAPHQPVPAHSSLTSFCTSPSSAVKSRNSRYTLAKRTYATSS